VEVALAECDRRPAAPDLRAIWRARLAGRATPLLLVVLYPGGPDGTAVSLRALAALCGPSGDQAPVLHDLDPAQIERLCDSSLDEPDRHAALRFLLAVIPDLDQPVVGLHNEGFFATDELHTGVPRRPDWGAATAGAAAALGQSGKHLLAALGFSVDPLPGQVAIL
jgi:hypothetical protein